MLSKIEATSALSAFGPYFQAIRSRDSLCPCDQLPTDLTSDNEAQPRYPLRAPKEFSIQAGSAMKRVVKKPVSLSGTNRFAVTKRALADLFSERIFLACSAIHVARPSKDGQQGLTLSVVSE